MPSVSATQAKVYLDVDKKPQTIAIEKALKVLAPIMSKAAGQRAFAKRSAHAVEVRWKPVCTVLAPSSDAPPRIRWEHFRRKKFGIDQKVVEEEFAAEYADEPCEWGPCP